MSKLAEIRVRLAMPAEMVVKLSDEHRQIIDDAKVLLDVVEAVLDGITPRKMADDLRELGPKHTSDEDETLAEAWDGLT